MAVFTVKSCNFPNGCDPWARAACLALCWSGSLWLVMGEAVFAQLEPLPTQMEGYQRFWAVQTPAQRLQLARRDPRPEPAAPTGAGLLGDPITLAEAQHLRPSAATPAPIAAAQPPSPQPPISSPAPALSPTPEDLNQQRLQRL
ncbi:MAG: hypothetical protein Q6K35_10190, partial [Thermostichus sp. DG02_4_bins_136]